MKKKNLVTLLGIALVVALVSTGVFYGLFVTKLKSENSGKTLVVAAKPLEAGTVLTAGDVKAVAWPADELPQGAFEKPEQVTGKTLFGTLSKAEPVLSSRLASDEGDGQSAGVPAGMRAVSVHVSDSGGVLALLHAGHRVDVQVLLPKTPTNDAQVRTALENIEVLSVNTKAEPNSQGFSLPVATLLVKPAAADVLALADAGARVRLTLRNPLDTATRTHTTLSVGSLMQGAGQ
ncbi:MAG: Flp pilus assembly protein CpaB [Acidobacteriota bacterium]|jgi:pilus assembly protein CpaB